MNLYQNLASIIKLKLFINSNWTFYFNKICKNKDKKAKFFER